MVSGVCDGFIGNRMLEGYVKQAWYLVEEGATPEQVDRAHRVVRVRDGSVPRRRPGGPRRQLGDRQHRRATRPGYVVSTLPDKLVALGRLGQKTGAGWYDYPEGPRRPVPSAAVEELIKAHRAEIGVTPRAIDESEIVDRLVYALVNEGARILEEGIAARASDIDVVYLTGYGFPRFRGGPMFYADQVGWLACWSECGSSDGIPTAIPDSGRPQSCSSAANPSSRHPRTDLVRRKLSVIYVGGDASWRPS